MAERPGERRTRTDATQSELDLVLDLARRVRRAEVDHARWGLSPHQSRALLAITRADAGMRVSALAGRLHIAPRSATEVADALEELGLVERAADPSDRRAVLLTLTDRGREVATEVRTARRASADRYLHRLAEADRAELRRLLTVLLEAVADEE